MQNYCILSAFKNEYLSNYDTFLTPYTYTRFLVNKARKSRGV